ncbi:MAG: argininosuccinate lyase [Cyclobacteriaceae bacterium]|nr:MAG: argininosuccinate lyase [Cyclobacteriaceae bacterium]
MKLWQQQSSLHPDVERFTTGRDREFDLWLAPFDVLGSIAHAIMLGEAGLLAAHEATQLAEALREIYRMAESGNFRIEEGVEDVHSQVELMLTRKLGDAGKKIHTGRSRNDQVLTDIRLLIRHEIENIVTETRQLFDLLLARARQHQQVLIPGYTHSQPAMPSSFGLWFGAWAESLVDDMILMGAAWQIANKNPLGSAAGYGSSFPLNRRRTTELLGFDDLNYNVVYAQMGRGKTERIVAYALAALGSTLARLATDVCMFVNPQFGFLRLPDSFTTGSSIMPHKKNPDVFELVRAYGNQLQALPNTIAIIGTNLMSGYHRDYQIVKEQLFPALRQITECLKITRLGLEQSQVLTGVIDEQQFDYIFSVEEVNRLVVKGVPFRDAYMKIKEAISAGTFTPDRRISHSHEGSIGNLCLPDIQRMMDTVIARFAFEKVNRALAALLAGPN